MVIGAGSGGVRASRVAASLGARVLLIEGSRLGGTCVNLGCVPKKLLVYAGRYGQALKEATSFGWSVPPVRFDWSTLIRNKDREIERLNRVYAKLLENSGVEVLRGWARFEEDRTVVVDGAEYRAKNVLLATGSKAWRPEFPGVAYTVTGRVTRDIRR